MNKLLNCPEAEGTVKAPGGKRNYNIKLARKKIRQVFQYLAELNRLKTQPTINLEKYGWLFWLDTLARHPTIVRGSDFNKLESFGVPQDPKQSSGGDFLVKVGRPKEIECPEPSIILKNWLTPGYASVGADPADFLLSELTFEDGVKEKFDDVSDRVMAFDDWLSSKNQWETVEKNSLDALGAFEDLFDLHGTIQRESEKYQIFAADGILVTEHEGNRVEHPIFLQRIALDFNSSVPEFALRDTQDPPEVHSWLLRYLGVDGKALKEVKQNLQENHYHPLGGEESTEFLKDMVQKLWKNGQYFNNEIEAREATGLYLYRKPLVFLGKRTFGLSESIETYMENIPQKEDFPEALLRVVGINTGKGMDKDDEELEKVDLLLTKFANMEQERVIHSLEDTGAVLVQGPPGTGKSHTIANLIGHLLAQNKSILVTSHTSKALRVVREHLAKPLQPLCVSVLQDDETNNRQLEESITGIVNYLSKTSEKKLNATIDKLRSKRDSLKGEYGDTKEMLVSNAEKEYQVLELGTKSMIPSQAARWLSENETTNSWISGPIEPGTEYPLSEEETRSLYELNSKISEDDEAILNSELPDESELPNPETFAEHFDGWGNFKSKDIKTGLEFWANDEQDADTLKALIPEVRESAEVLGETDPWIREFLELGQRPAEERKPWADLVDLVNRCNEAIPPREALVLEHGPSIESEATDEENFKLCKDILKHLDGKKGNTHTFNKLLHPKWAEFVQSAKVDSGPPETVEHFNALRAHLGIAITRRNLLQRWERLAEHLDEPPIQIEELGKKPEKKLRPIALQIDKAINLLDESWSKIQETLVSNGFDWDEFLRKGVPFSDANSAMKLAMETLLIPVLNARIDFCAWAELQNKQRQWVEYLDGFSRKDSSYNLVKQLRSGIQKADYDSYRQAWEHLQQLHDLQEGHAQRLAIIAKIKEAAPGWADDISTRKEAHSTGEPPGNPDEAWTHRLWDQLLAEHAKTDLDQLQSKLNNLKDKIQEATANYVEKLSWLAQLKRTGLEQQQALNGWLAIHKKIGRGTGKHVRELKQEGKSILKKCQDAVPVWIMPMSRVVESFDIANSGFDVVIIDEASQSDVLGLVAFAMAKEVIVVGDHEQVSPYAVGFKTDKMHELIDEILTDIPNNKLYDAKTSIYDLAKQSFGGTIRLVEHFRCVPDIIQFSNHLCYGGEIKSLRESSASRIKPALVSHFVEGAKEDNSINQEEALEVVALILALTKFKEYSNSTIGVISMVGTGQALYIDSLLRRRMTVAEYERRRILCGNAAQFQGDERDVVFISMVNAPSASGKPLHLRVREDAKRVFNVAASRSRDQLWVVHSLDPGRDLKPNDLRLRLISHAENPDSLRPKSADKKLRKLSSALEEQVYDKLVEAKYSTLISCEVGEFVIDLAVIGAKGNRIAIQCDGDKEVSRNYLEKSLHRQLTLERLGWRFIRVRGSEFLRHPDEALDKIQKRLKKYDIEPSGHLTNDPAEKSAKEKNKELLSEVKKRAQMSRSRWKEIPSVSSIVSKRKADE